MNWTYLFIGFNCFALIVIGGYIECYLKETIRALRRIQSSLEEPSLYDNR